VFRVEFGCFLGEGFFFWAFYVEWIVHWVAFGVAFVDFFGGLSILSGLFIGLLLEFCGFFLGLFMLSKLFIGLLLELLLWIIFWGLSMRVDCSLGCFWSYFCGLFFLSLSFRACSFRRIYFSTTQT